MVWLTAAICLIAIVGLDLYFTCNIRFGIKVNQLFEFVETNQLQKPFLIVSFVYLSLFFFCLFEFFVS